MQALRWHAAGDVRLDELPEPSLEANTAIVEVAFCGICGTDLHEYRHGPSMIRTTPHPLSGQQAPLTMGHEFSGRITAIDSPTAEFAVGTRVAIDPCLRCGTCFWCRTGAYHLCAQGGSIGLAGDGALASHVRVPIASLNLVPDGVSDEFAAMAEPIAVGLHAVTRAGVGPGDSVLVLGAGPIGIAALMMARAAGAAAMFVSEPNAGRHEVAHAVGATETFDPRSVDVRREVFLRTGRRGPDVVIDGTGNPDAIDLGIRSLRRGGHMAIAGITDGVLSIDIKQLVLYERTVSGSLGYNNDIPRVLDLMAAGRVDPSPLLTGVRKLSEAPETFEELASPTEHIKVLLAPREH